MAFISQDMKKKIQKLLKNIIPDSWKWTLAIKNHSTIILKVRTGPVKLSERGHCELRANSQAVKENKILQDIFNALNMSNYDNSESQVDFFDVGYYSVVKFGELGDVFVSTGEEIVIT